MKTMKEQVPMQKVRIHRCYVCYNVVEREGDLCVACSLARSRGRRFYEKRAHICAVGVGAVRW